MPAYRLPDFITDLSKGTLPSLTYNGAMIGKPQLTRIKYRMANTRAGREDFIISRSISFQDKIRKNIEWMVIRFIQALLQAKTIILKQMQGRPRSLLAINQVDPISGIKAATDH